MGRRLPLRLQINVTDFVPEDTPSAQFARFFGDGMDFFFEGEPNLFYPDRGREKNSYGFTVTYADGVTLSMENWGMIENYEGGARIIGEPIAPPVVIVPDYVLVIPEDLTIEYGQVDPPLGSAVNIIALEEFPEGAYVDITVDPDGDFLNLDAGDRAIPYRIYGPDQGELFLAGELPETPKIRCWGSTVGEHGIGGGLLSMYIAPDAWYTAKQGCTYFTNIRFTSEYHMA